MGWLADMLGGASTATAPSAAEPQRRKAADHIARFERAVAQCEKAVANGEATPARLAELHKHLGYWRQIAELERSMK